MIPAAPGFSSTASAGSGSTAVDATLKASTAAVGVVAQGSAASSAAPWFYAVTNPTTAVNVANPTTSFSLSSQHTVTVGNPTTAVTVSSGVILAAGSSANTLGAVAQGAGSTSVSPWYVISSAGGGGSTTVDANLTSAGSTKLVGQVTVANPTTSVSLSSQATVTVGNPTTAVTVSSGVILAAGSSANTIGAVAQGAGSTSVSPWYVISSAGGGAGSTTVDANLTSAGSTKLIGLVEGIPFSSDQAAFTTLNTSVDVSMLAANANRKGCIIQNASTGTALLVRLSTAAVSSASAYQFQVAANAFAVMGSQVGNIQNFTGPMRCKMNSTLVAGPVFITEFTA
jgi:hypothetical protein